AGYEAIQNLQRGVFRSAHVEFYVPTISLSMPNPTPWVSLWAGVGGDTDVTGSASATVLVQAGVSALPPFVATPTPHYAQYNYAWWEVVPYPPSNHPNTLSLSLNPGEDVIVYVSSNANNNGYDYFFVQNVSRGNYHDCTLRTDSTTVANTCPLD